MKTTGWLWLSILAASSSCAPNSHEDTTPSLTAPSPLGSWAAIAGICILTSGCDLGMNDPGYSPFLPAPGWEVPTCDAVNGAPGVTVLDGLSGVPLPTADDIEQPIFGQEVPGDWSTWSAYGYISDIVAAYDTPGLLFAVDGNAVLFTEDFGCTWVYHPALKNLEWYWGPGGSRPRLEYVGDGMVYLWGESNTIARFTTTTLESLEVHVGETGLWDSPYHQVQGFGHEPGDGNHLFVLNQQGEILESLDGGETWVKTLGAINPKLVGYGWQMRGEFHPVDPSRITIHGTLGSYHTHDGGLSWFKLAPATDTVLPVAFSALAVSPTDPDLIWGIGLAMDPSKPIDEQRHLYRSTDGGLIFEDLGDGTRFDLRASSKLVVAPYDNYGVYAYGSDHLILHDAFSEISLESQPNVDIRHMAFSPADEGVFYLATNGQSYWQNN